jgi:hypothetical protein
LRREKRREEREGGEKERVRVRRKEKVERNGERMFLGKEERNWEYFVG